MHEVIAYLQGAGCATEIKRMAYIMFRIESGNGEHGINNNYCGFQADSGRWPAAFDSRLAGTVTETENGTGKTRIFLAFHKWQDCVDMLLNRVQGRGLYIGEPGINTEHDLAESYYRQWVTGNPNAAMPPQESANFQSMYGQATALFRGGTIDKPQPPVHVVDDTMSADDLNAAELEKKDT
jgi:hypothetical protein